MENPLIIFVTAATSSNKTAEENLGLAYLAAVCRSQIYDVIIIDGWLGGLSSEQIVEKIMLERKPLFIGLSCNQLNGTSAIEIVHELKKRKCESPFVAGGFAPTFNPLKFLESGFDFVSITEGEKTILGLADYLFYGTPALNKIDGLCYLDGLRQLHCNECSVVSDINELPFPSRDTMMLAIKEKTPVNIVTSRGCMANCMFCSVSAFWKLAGSYRWRGRSINSIVDELEELYKKGVRHIKIVDDSFIEPPRGEEWCELFADEITNRGLVLKLRITLRADKVTEGIVAALTRAGCNLYACGIENFSDSALRRMGKKANSKHNMHALDIFKKYNVYVQMGYILFDYGTTLAELKENYEMLKKYSWTICRGIFSEMYAARGTPYTSLLLKKGLVKGDIHLENYYYNIVDTQAQMVYGAIKSWHLSHAKMYNMVIEPINKPKVLDEDCLANFYELYLGIRNQDLIFMGDVLEHVENGIRQNELDDFVKTSIISSSQWFERYNTKVGNLFDLAGIDYMAEDDPFTT